MPFQYVLANLVAESPGTLGAIFLDDAGETVDLVSAEVSPYDLRVIGAYLGIHMRQFSDLLHRMDLGAPDMLHIRHERANLFLKTLPDGYCLALVQKQSKLPAVAERALRAAAEEIGREVFG